MILNPDAVGLVSPHSFKGILSPHVLKRTNNKLLPTQKQPTENLCSHQCENRDKLTVKNNPESHDSRERVCPEDHNIVPRSPRQLRNIQTHRRLTTTASLVSGFPSAAGVSGSRGLSAGRGWEGQSLGAGTCQI